MKLVRRLLLGSIAGSFAGLGSAAGARAADLPIAKAAPVEYVRVCSTYGEGFFYVPGTESCLRISGRVRFDALYSEPITRAADAIGTRARGRLNVDHRTATAYGLLRTYIRFEITRDSGTPFGRTGAIGTTPDLTQGFIQFGGLTAGRATSFFDNPDLPTEHMGTLRFSDAPDVNLLAYTFSFGSGFSATLSLEDAQERRVVSEPLIFVPGFTTFPFGTAAPVPFVYGGQRTPDLVGNIRYTGTWGGVQLSGAVHQIRDVGGYGLVNPVTGTALPTFADTEYGFAVTAQGSVTLPFLGTGDAAWLALTYTDGALGYILGGTGAGLTAGSLALPLTDAFVDPFTGDFRTTEAWSIAGGITHNWTPTVRSSLFGSWARFDAPGGASTIVPTTSATLADGTAGSRIGFVDFDEYRIGANTFWSPVAGLNLGLEVLYTKLDPQGRVAVPESNLAGTPVGTFRPRGSEDIWEGRLRVQRDF
jgi:hypothetical protein